MSVVPVCCASHAHLFAHLLQAGVAASSCQQVFVPVAFHQFAALEDEDLRSIADGGQAMGGDLYGFAAHQFVNSLLYRHFAFGVERGGGFVKDDDGRIFQQGAGDAEVLLFAAERAQRG